jgi:hypothetical protein
MGVAMQSHAGKIMGGNYDVETTHTTVAELAAARRTECLVTKGIHLSRRHFTERELSHWSNSRWIPFPVRGGGYNTWEL